MNNKEIKVKKIKNSIIFIVKCIFLSLLFNYLTIELIDLYFQKL